MKRIYLAAFASMLLVSGGIVACTQQEEAASLTAAESLIAVYKATPNPSASVEAQLAALDNAAKAATAASGVGSPASVTAIEALIAYLGTAAPGTGSPAVLPSTSVAPAAG